MTREKCLYLRSLIEKAAQSLDDKTALTAKVLNAPSREDVDFPFEEQLIVELYSK